MPARFSQIPMYPPRIRVLMAKDLQHVTLYGNDLRKIMHKKNTQDVLDGKRGA